MLANDTEYGLAAYFYTGDLRRAWHIAEKLEYGMVRHKGGAGGWSGLPSGQCYHQMTGGRPALLPDWQQILLFVL